jgi:hypothetical protein
MHVPASARHHAAKAMTNRANQSVSSARPITRSRQGQVSKRRANHAPYQGVAGRGDKSKGING